MAFFTLKMIIHLPQKALIALLLIKEITILEKYSDLGHVLSKKLAEILSQCVRINEHIIKL